MLGCFPLSSAAYGGGRSRINLTKEKQHRSRVALFRELFVVPLPTAQKS